VNISKPFLELSNTILRRWKLDWEIEEGLVAKPEAVDPAQNRYRKGEGRRKGREDEEREGRGGEYKG
jgi:hypothetical protein